HSRQHFHTSQFPQAHLDSPHPASFRGRSLGDISIEEKRGHYHRGSTSRITRTGFSLFSFEFFLPDKKSKLDRLKPVAT
ncbi:MAG TPA: hypothetical protein VHS29_10965, partial [Candidatus Acidoferrales bacterium]|nr:hypothetical protein [Candidatus Acidoferrales bacterium]